MGRTAIFDRFLQLHLHGQHQTEMTWVQNTGEPLTQLCHSLLLMARVLLSIRQAQPGETASIRRTVDRRHMHHALIQEQLVDPAVPKKCCLLSRQQH